jgi:hypothetical protein
MESSARNNTVHVTERVVQRIKPEHVERYVIVDEGEAPVKGLGVMRSYTIGRAPGVPGRTGYYHDAISQSSGGDSQSDATSPWPQMDASIADSPTARTRGLHRRRSSLPKLNVGGLSGGSGASSAAPSPRLKTGCGSTQSSRGLCVSDALLVGGSESSPRSSGNGSEMGLRAARTAGGELMRPGEVLGLTPLLQGSESSNNIVGTPDSASTHIRGQNGGGARSKESLVERKKRRAGRTTSLNSPQWFNHDDVKKASSRAVVSNNTN